jgi:hypothetical protein
MSNVLAFPQSPRLKDDMENATSAQMISTMDLLLSYMVHHRGLEWAVEIFNGAVTRQIEKLTP